MVAPVPVMADAATAEMTGAATVVNVKSPDVVVRATLFVETQAVVIERAGREAREALAVRRDERRIERRRRPVGGRQAVLDPRARGLIRRPADRRRAAVIAEAATAEMAGGATVVNVKSPDVFVRLTLLVDFTR